MKPAVLGAAEAGPPPVRLVGGEGYRVQGGDAPVAGPGTRITVAGHAAAVADVREDGAFVRRRFTTGR